MTRRLLIENTMKTIYMLPDDKINEILNYAEYILKKYEEGILQKGIEKLVSESESFYFLKEEEDLYTVKDLKEKYK
jgi:hypothetical protein